MNRWIRPNWICCIFLVVLQGAVCRAEDDLKVVKPEECKDYVGQNVTVEFVVHGTRQLNDKAVGFLNAAKEPTDPKDFTVFITSQALKKPDANADTAELANYFLCKIQVAGTVQLYRNKPEIVVDSLDQIKILERPKVTKLEEVKDKVGQAVVVEFIVQASHEEPGQRCFLNSEADYNDPQDVSIFITTTGIEKFAAKGKVKHPGDYFLHKKIRVTGTVKLFKNKPQIDVGAPERINLVEE